MDLLNNQNFKTAITQLCNISSKGDTIASFFGDHRIREGKGGINEWD